MIILDKYIDDRILIIHFIFIHQRHLQAYFE
jgi:hypothetical protein